MGYVDAGCVVEVHDATAPTTKTTRSARSSSAASRAITLFAGYLDDPATTAACFDDGWFLTGDRRSPRCRRPLLLRRPPRRRVEGGRRERVDGRGRAGARRASRQCSRSRSIGHARPDPRRGAGRLRRRRRRGRTTRRSKQLRDWCAERLAKSKRPRDITFVDELPRTSVGKIRKFLLKDPHGRITATRRAKADALMTVLTDELLASFDASRSPIVDKAVHACRRVIYTSAEFLDFERDAAVRPRVAVRRPGQPHPEAGDYFTPQPTASRSSSPVPRTDSSGRSRAICQHRGMQVADDAGNCRKFTCPYHQWSLRPRRPPARRAGHGAHRGLRQEGLPAAGAGGRAVAGLRVRQLRPDAAPLGADAAPLRAVPRALRPRECGVPRHLHAAPTCRGTGR